MKTVQQIQNRINELMDYCQSFKPSEGKTFNKERKELSLLNTIKMYLEDNPSEDFIKKEVERLENRVMLIEDGFMNYLHNTPEDSDILSKKRQEYNKINNVPEIRRQLRRFTF